MSLNPLQTALFTCAGRAFRMLQNITDLSPDFISSSLFEALNFLIFLMLHLHVLHPSVSIVSFSFKLDKFVKYLCDLDEKCIFTLCHITVETRIFVTLCKGMTKSDKTELKCVFQSHICLHFLNLVHVFMLADHT